MVKIKDIPKIERPRERLERYGPEKLSTSELLAIILRTGGKGINVVELANRILKKFSSDGLGDQKRIDMSFGICVDFFQCLEDDLLTLSKILERVATIEQNQPHEFFGNPMREDNIVHPT